MMKPKTAVSFFRRASTAVFPVLCAAVMATSPAYAQYNAFEDPGTGATTGAVSGPDLKSTSATGITGGTISVGSSISVVAVFRNGGTAPVTVGAVNLYPSSTVSATVGLNQCSAEPIPPGAECAVTVQVTGMQTGAWRIEILMDHNGRTRLATASITGNVEANGDETAVVRSDLEAVPSEIDFGSITTGKPLVRSVTIRNVTSQEVSVKDIRIESPMQGGLSQINTCPETLRPGDACAVSLTWAPVLKGPLSAVLLTEHSGVGSVTQVSVKGDFRPDVTAAATIYPETMPDRGLLISDMAEVDFGSAIKGASAITVSLVNIGDTPLDINTIRLSGSDSGLSIARMGCVTGRNLMPSEACPLTINWLPSRAGAVIDAVQIEHTGARGILVLPVKGDAESAVSRESLAVRQSSDGGADVTRSVAVTPVLDGYVVTSHSPTRAVISGPVGSQVVRDGQTIVLSGVRWEVDITASGVTLRSNDDVILLVFDRSLRSMSGSGTTGTNTTGTTP